MMTVFMLTYPLSSIFVVCRFFVVGDLPIEAIRELYFSDWRGHWWGFVLPLWLSCRSDRGIPHHLFSVPTTFSVCPFRFSAICRVHFCFLTASNFDFFGVISFPIAFSFNATKLSTSSSYCLWHTVGLEWTGFTS